MMLSGDTETFDGSHSPGLHAPSFQDHVPGSWVSGWVLIVCSQHSRPLPALQKVLEEVNTHMRELVRIPGSLVSARWEAKYYLPQFLPLHFCL